MSDVQFSNMPIGIMNSDILQNEKKIIEPIIPKREEVFVALENHLKRINDDAIIK